MRTGRSEVVYKGDQPQEDTAQNFVRIVIGGGGILREGVHSWVVIAASEEGSDRRCGYDREERGTKRPFSSRG